MQKKFKKKYFLPSYPIFLGYATGNKEFFKAGLRNCITLAGVRSFYQQIFTNIQGSENKTIVYLPVRYIWHMLQGCHRSGKSQGK